MRLDIKIADEIGAWSAEQYRRFYMEALLADIRDCRKAGMTDEQIVEHLESEAGRRLVPPKWKSLEETPEI